MTSDQTFRKIKKRAKKAGLNQPVTLSRKGSRWFLIDRMAGVETPSRLTASMIERSLYGDRTGFRGFLKDLIRWFLR